MSEAAGSTVWKDRKHVMWFPLSFTAYEIKDGRLHVKRGFLKESLDEVLLYRIVDIRLERSLGQKIFGTGTIKLCTRIDHEKNIDVINIKKPLEVKNMLSKMVEDEREAKNVVGQEFYGEHMDGMCKH